jgi:catechol 2,3-dioxygenase-like lactoylglutathione lyase family enzyme
MASVAKLLSEAIPMNRPGLTFSHIGVFVHDMAPMEDFYTRVLEFTVTDRGQLPGTAGPIHLVFLSRDPDEHHQIVLVAGRPRELQFNVLNQLSMRADSLATLRAMHTRLVAAGAPAITPITHGNAVSVYALDPEGTRLELFIDTPWYVSQPVRAPLDLTLNDEELMRHVETHARTLPGFRPRSAWRAEMARHMRIS